MNYKALSLLCGYLIVVFVCLTFMLSSTLLLFGLSVSPYTIGASFIITVFAGIYLTRRYFTKESLFCSLGVFFMAIILSGIFSLLFFDLSYDGQVYHQETIIQLAGGWNPTKGKLYPVLDLSNVDSTHSFLWENHYPRASELTQASIYQFTRCIESGKAINLLLIIAAFCFALTCLLRLTQIKLGKAIFYSALAAFNPSTINQSLTFYIDGNLASLFLCLLCVLVLFYFEPKWYLGIILIFMIVFFVNIKFTAIFYFGILAIGFLLIAFLNRQIVVFKRSCAIFVCSLILGLLVCGYNPYVTNYKEHHHPFYPLMGHGKVDIMKSNTPQSKGFNKMNRFKKILVSVLSEGSIRDVKLKPPFTFNLREILAYTATEQRLAGFGPLFSGILILNFILLLNGLRNFWQNRILYLILLIVTSSVFIHPEAWWARYVPQFWLIPILTLIFLPLSQKHRWLNLINVSLAIVIFFNVVIIAVPSLSIQALKSYLAYRQLNKLAKEKMPIKVRFVNGFRSNRVRLAEHHIHYVEVSYLSDVNSTNLYGSPTRIQTESQELTK